MTLTLETGAGVLDANAYVTTSFVDSYLSERNRSSENSWDSLDASVKEAAVIAATQYIDFRFGARFRSNKATYFDGLPALAMIVFSDQPTAAETVTVGDKIYVFVDSLSALTSDYEVLIGSSTSDTVENLVAAITADSSVDDVYMEYITANTNATAEVDSDDDSQINLTALMDGDSGNDITFETTATNLTLTGFLNGRDGGSQRLEFPRSYLYDSDGVRVAGIPRQLKWATAEYAVRAASSELFQDPSVDGTGRAVKRKKTGPLETEFVDGAALDLLIRPYPAADYLLKEYLKPIGVSR